MKKLLGIVVLSLLLSGNAYGDQQKKFQTYVLTNLSYEYLECHSYFLIMSQALKNNNSSKPELINKYIFLSNEFGDMGHLFGLEAGMSNEALLARNKLISDEMINSLDKNFINVPILIDKYEKFCQSIFKNPNNRKKFWLNKAKQELD